jgi:hypothetical protein
VPFGYAQASKTVNGIIAQDTTWTLANSPISLAGPVAVNQGVTLTIEAGATVNLNNYYLQVNGTLIAKGTSANQIQFNGGNTEGITFTPLSNGWNEKTGSGCIIQNAIINSKVIAFENSVKLDHDTLLSSLSAGGSSVVTNCDIKGGASIGDTAIFSNNVISGTLSVGPGAVVPVVSVSSGSSPDTFPIVSNNFIHGGYPNFAGTSNIGIACMGYANIVNNTVSGCEEGIRIYSSQTSGFPLIDKNIVVSNQAGIVIQAANGQSTVDNSPFIKENLIINNTEGISVENDGGTVTPAIMNNNIFENRVNLYWGLSNNIDVTNNWWGTVDPQSINQTIGDSKNDFNLGTVNFVPFLIEPYPQAPTLNNPIPTSNPSSSPTPTVTATPATPEFPLAISLAVVVIVSTAAVSVYGRRLKLKL